MMNSAPIGSPVCVNACPWREAGRLQATTLALLSAATDVGDGALIWRSPPCAMPPGSNHRALTPSLPGHATTKPPVGSTATAGLKPQFVVAELTRKSLPAGTCAAAGGPSDTERQKSSALERQR